jgi:hypothetical protein
MTDELPDPWTRQKGETPQAFYCFEIYLDQETPRGLARVVSESGRSKPLIERWSARWAWRERARMWDVHKQEEIRRAQVKDAVSMARRQAVEAAGYQRVLAAPMIVLVERLETAIGQAELQALSIGDLMTLTMLTAKLWPAIARAEREARGAPIQDLSQFYDEETGTVVEDVVDPAAIYEWYRHAAAALEAAGVKRPELEAGSGG